MLLLVGMIKFPVLTSRFDTYLCREGSLLGQKLDAFDVLSDASWL